MTLPADASACLDEDRILAYLHGRLGVDDRAAIRDHMLACDRCREWVAAVAHETELTLQMGPASTSDPPTEIAGAMTTRYTATARIGRGAMGEVYRATDTVLHREVALKFVTDESAIARARLVREARAAARINHPNVVAVHDVGVIDGELFIAMELVEGARLDQWLAAGRTAREIVAAFVQAGRALEAAHAAGVLHRDFKPSNVLVSPGGRVRVADFGLARLLTDEQDDPRPAPSPAEAGSDDLTVTGTVMGTPAYMSPEQRTSARFDARSDQYSFAVALYEALTGNHPFPAGPADTTLERPLPPKDSTLPARAIDVVARGLNTDPADRWPSMTEFLAALEAADRLAEPRAAATRAGNNWWITAAIGVVALAGLSLWGLRGRDRPERPAVATEAGAARESDHKPQVEKVTRLTSDPGCEQYPAFSPDGRTIYYDGEIDDDNEIFAVDVATRQTRRLTSAPETDIAPRVSPDGRRLAWMFGAARDKQLRILRLDEPGAVPTEAGPLDATWWVEWASDTTIVSGRIDGSIAQIEIGPDNLPASTVVGARVPDRFRVYTARRLRGDRWLFGTEFEGESRLYVGGLDSGLKLVELPDWGFTADSGLAVGPGGDGAYFVGRLSSDNRAVLRWSTGSTRLDALTLASPGYGVDVTRDGAHLVYSTCLARTWIARVDGAGAEPVRIISSLEWDATTPIPIAGNRMLVTSDRDSGSAIWLYDLATGRGQSISPPTAFFPDVSRDGGQVAFMNQPDQYGGLFVLDLTTRVSRQLTRNTSDRSPMFGPDGAIYVVRDDDGLRVVRVTMDGEVTRVTGPGVTDFAVSPVGDRIAFVRELENGDQHVYLQQAGGEPRRLEQLPGAFYVQPRFSSDGKKLVLVRDHRWLLELTVDDVSASPRTLYTAPQTASLRYPAYALDGAGVFVSITASEGDLMLVDGHFP